LKERVDYKSTVNLPQTDFAMKAGLGGVNRPCSSVESQDIYGELRRLASGRPRFVRDGPPYANGVHRACRQQGTQGLHHVTFA
jgi:isoleucyl-tRNA synthetase